MLAKLPQLILIMRYKSVKGLSAAAYFFESFACSVSVAYLKRNPSLPFVMVGDSVFLLIQNLIILSLILAIQKRSITLLLFYVFYGVMHSSLFFTAALSAKILNVLFYASIPMLIMCKWPTFKHIYYMKNTGRISFLSHFMLAISCFSKILFTRQLKDPSNRMILAETALNGMANWWIVLMFIYFWASKKPLKQKVTSKLPKIDLHAAKKPTPPIGLYKKNK